jgi:hypothetical protein
MRLLQPAPDTAPDAFFAGAPRRGRRFRAAKAKRQASLNCFRIHDSHNHYYGTIEATSNFAERKSLLFTPQQGWLFTR